MRAEVDCVAVTDHNSSGWIDTLKHAYRQMHERRPDGFRELHLFPGVEISVNGGFHLLAILDKDRTKSDVDRLLGAVEYDGTEGDSDGVTRKSAVGVIAAVLAAGGLPIPAHADQVKGLLHAKSGSGAVSALDPNTLRQVLNDSQLLALEVVDRDIAKPQCYIDTNRKLAEVVGSDCHDFEGPHQPGSRFTWIKMAQPSLEGLRLALLDGAGFSVRRSDDPESFDPFRVPDHFITAIEISKARYMGQGNPAMFPLSPWFNAFVGGRGTGKSTVIHALRLAYRRGEELSRLAQGHETRQAFEAFQRIPKNRADEGGLRAETEIRVTHDGCEGMSLPT